MSDLEREIIEKFHQLNPEAKQRVRDVINQEVKSNEQAFDYAAWFRDIEALRQEIDANPERSNKSFDVTEVLREICDGLDDPD
jgi:hypothetical protein